MHMRIPTGFTPYAPRSLRHLGTRVVAGHHLKCYALGIPGAMPAPEQVGAALAFAQQRLVEPRRGPTLAGLDWSRVPRHGLGVLIVHRGREGVFALLDVWIGENMLEHHVGLAGPGPGAGFGHLPAEAAAMCVWELEVLAHERRAWLAHMLTPDGHGDAEAYLADRAAERP
jgi:hypothetical protein